MRLNLQEAGNKQRVHMYEAQQLKKNNGNRFITNNDEQSQNKSSDF